MNLNSKKRPGSHFFDAPDKPPHSHLVAPTPGFGFRPGDYNMPQILHVSEYSSIMLIKGKN